MISVSMEKEYDVLLAQSGKEALEKMKGEEIDLVLLDIAMQNIRVLSKRQLPDGAL